MFPVDGVYQHSTFTSSEYNRDRIKLIKYLNLEAKMKRKKPCGCYNTTTELAN